MQSFPRLVAAALILLCFLASAGADTLVLNSGKTIDGNVIKNGDRYWVQTPDGKSQFVPAADVKELITSAGSTITGGGVTLPSASSKSPTFATAKAKAEAAETPIAAIAIWQTFLDASPAPASADANLAKDELKKWQKLADDNAEKISGRWVGGAERKAILEQADALMKDGIQLLKDQKTLQAVKKFEEAVKVYPNSYEATSFLGLIDLNANKTDDAIKYFSACLKLRPNAPDALNNLGICYVAMTETSKSPQLWDRAFEKFKAAAEAQDDPAIAHNINKALAVCPPTSKTSPVAKQAAEAAAILASRYRLAAADLVNRQFIVMPPRAPKPGGADIRPGMISSGTGFIIQDDGLILTNRHVVKDAENLLVIIEGQKKQVSAKVVVIDKENDLALIRIKTDEKLPTLPFAKNDSPNEGAECYAIGFPLLDRLGASLKVTRGIVSGTNKAEGGVDILTDAKVNPGNSGGPLVDKFGQVMGIVTMKSITSGAEDSYGMAISAGRIRKFLTANKFTPTPGDSDKPLSPEEVVAKVKSATVCIIATQ